MEFKTPTIYRFTVTRFSYYRRTTRISRPISCTCNACARREFTIYSFRVSISYLALSAHGVPFVLVFLSVSIDSGECEPSIERENERQWEHIGLWVSMLSSSLSPFGVIKFLTRKTFQCYSFLPIALCLPVCNTIYWTEQRVLIGSALVFLMIFRCLFSS